MPEKLKYKFKFLNIPQNDRFVFGGAQDQRIINLY